MNVMTIILRSLGVFVGLILLFGLGHIAVKNSAPANSQENAQDSALLLAEINSSTAETALLNQPSFSYLADDSRQIERARPDNDTENRLLVANDLAKQKQFDRALIILGNIKSEDLSRYDVRFLKARIQSWSGHHAQADHGFQTLRMEFPQDPDIMVSHGFLKYYQGQYRQAETLFQTVLAKHPGYTDARNGLARTRRAMAQN